MRLSIATQGAARFGFGIAIATAATSRHNSTFPRAQDASIAGGAPSARFYFRRRSQARKALRASKALSIRAHSSSRAMSSLGNHRLRCAGM